MTHKAALLERAEAPGDRTKTVARRMLPDARQPASQPAGGGEHGGLPQALPDATGRVLAAPDAGAVNPGSFPESPQQPPPAHPGSRRHPCIDTIAPALAADIERCARELTEAHGELLRADPGLKHRVAARIYSLLPPRLRPGRKPMASVSAAIRLRDKFKVQYPKDSPAGIWRRIYPRVIPGYHTLNPSRQSEERRLLRDRVRSRVNQRRRREVGLRS